MRLGVAAALVDGHVVAGDVQVDLTSGAVVATGLPAVAGGGLAVPGFVDLQINGFAGVDLRRADADGYATVAGALAERGVTAFQPTFHSQSVEAYERSLAVLADVLATPPEGARVLPAHLEGPFLSPRWNGAHDVTHLLGPSPEVLDRLLAAGPVGFTTVAPELPGGLDLVRRLVDAGVVVSIGHSDATSAQVDEAMAAGVTHLTHCWNAHRRLSARDPGPAGTALSREGIVVGLIVDLVHVAPEVVTTTWRAAAGRIAATTDAIAAAGTIAAAGSDVARTDGGTIAGGLAGPDDCLRNLVSLGVDVADAVHACGGVQRQLLGLPAVRLRPGDPADVVVLDDALERPPDLRRRSAGLERGCLTSRSSPVNTALHAGQRRQRNPHPSRPVR